MTRQGSFICKLILFSLSLIAVICRAIFGKTGWSEKAEILSKCCCSYLLIDRRMILIRSVPSLYYLAKFWCISPGCRRWCSRLSFLWPWTEHQKWTEKALWNKIVFIFWFWFLISCKIGFAYNHCWFVIYRNVLLNPRRSSTAFSTGRPLKMRVEGLCTWIWASWNLVQLSTLAAAKVWTFIGF